MDKIKAFFNNTIVKVVAWVLLAVVSVVLILGGASVADISKGVELVAGIVAAIATLVAFIASKIKKLLLLHLLQARLKRNKTYFLPGCGFALISWVIGGASCEPIALFYFTNNSDMGDMTEWNKDYYLIFHSLR